METRAKKLLDPKDSHTYYTKGLDLIRLLKNDAGIKNIAFAAQLGHFEAKIYLKDNNIEERANDLLKEKKNPRVLGETESYLKSKEILKSRGIERPPVTQQQTKDQNKRIASEVGETGNLAETPHKGFFGKLVNGDYGLAKTYWLFGVLVAAIFIIVMNVPMSWRWYLFIAIGYTIYLFPLYVGIWSAANKYQGHKVWAVLAKIVVIIGVFFAVTRWMIILVLYSEV